MWAGEEKRVPGGDAERRTGNVIMGQTGNTGQCSAARYSIFCATLGPFRKDFVQRRTQYQVRLQILTQEIE